MNVLYDTNIILDAMQKREGFCREAEILIQIAKDKIVTAFLTATSVTTIYYLLAKHTDRKTAETQVTILLKIFRVAAVDASVLSEALRLEFGDYEDAVVVASAEHAGAEHIVTRNTKDFNASRIPIYAPKEFMILCQDLINRELRR
jgi:predicted nucleic acid-binding protein